MQNHTPPRRPPLHHHRPPPQWWPENEPWPPHQGRFQRAPFFRRLGCLFGIFNLLGMIFLLFILAMVAHILGFIEIAPRVVQLTLPFGGIALVLVLVGLFAIGLNLRRAFRPLDGLLEAAERISAGDYTVRVVERGPGGVRSLMRAFNKMAARLHQTDEQRRNLLADVTHELRTPLTVIQGNLEGMLDGVYPADESNLRAVLDETHLLSRLIDDLRTLALAESGALQLRKEPTDPNLLLSETVSAFQPQAEAAGVKLTVTGADPSTSSGQALPIISLDPARVRQVLANLIANALRYSPTGGTVIIHKEFTNGHIQITIKDSGPGIPAEDLPHIFERFYKSADSGGMGLGLAIARHIMLAHGGNISVESVLGQGTSIRVEFPI